MGKAKKKVTKNRLHENANFSFNITLNAFKSFSSASNSFILSFDASFLQFCALIAEKLMKINFPIQNVNIQNDRF